MSTDIRKKLVNLIGLQVAMGDMGVYPQAIHGGPNAYTKRTDWMEGWNSYSKELLGKWGSVNKWLNGIPEDQRHVVEDLLIAGKLELSIDEDSIQPCVNCNDLFYWGCADGEDISLTEIPDLLQALHESTENGTDLWACRKRKMRPQKPVYRHLNQAEAALFDAAGPPREE